MSTLKKIIATVALLVREFLPLVGPVWKQIKELWNPY